MLRLPEHWPTVLSLQEQKRMKIAKRSTSSLGYWMACAIVRPLPSFRSHPSIVTLQDQPRTPAVRHMRRWPPARRGSWIWTKDDLSETPWRQLTLWLYVKNIAYMLCKQKYLGSLNFICDLILTARTVRTYSFLISMASLRRQSDKSQSCKSKIIYVRHGLLTNPCAVCK